MILAKLAVFSKLNNLYILFFVYLLSLDVLFNCRLAIELDLVAYEQVVSFYHYQRNDVTT